MTSTTKHERRAFRRYPCLNYIAVVTPRSRLRPFAKSFVANLIDFHRFGACLCAERRVKVGMKLWLTIKSENEEVKAVRATVCHVRILPSGCWFGVTFQRVTGKSGEQGVLAGLEKLVRADLS